MAQLQRIGRFRPRDPPPRNEKEPGLPAGLQVSIKSTSDQLLNQTPAEACEAQEEEKNDAKAWRRHA